MIKVDKNKLKFYREKRIKLNRTYRYIIRLENIRIKTRRLQIYKRENEHLKPLEKQVKKNIDDIENKFIQKIFYLRYIKLLSWENIAGAVGGNNSADTVRMIAKRYMEKGEN